MVAPLPGTPGTVDIAGLPPAALLLDPAPLRSRRGAVDEARRWNRQALAQCEALGDRDGTRAYRENADLLDVLALSRAQPEEGARVIACRRAIAQAQDLSDDGECERSTAVLTAVLAGLDRGPERRYRAKVLGLLGWNAVRTGAVGIAREYTEGALAQCRADGDDDGVRIYSANLAEIESLKRGARHLATDNRPPPGAQCRHAGRDRSAARMTNPAAMLKAATSAPEARNRPYRSAVPCPGFEIGQRLP